MGNKLYVGNLPYSVRDSDLEQAFMQLGQIISAKVMVDRETGRSKGFGFVEMSNESEANTVIQHMNGQLLEGRSLVVNIARPVDPRPPRNANHGHSTRPPINSNGYAGRGDGGFRSPYGTGPRTRQVQSFGNDDRNRNRG